MSGPKRAKIRFVYVNHYDPTQTRLADLRNFATKLEKWLVRHYDFLERNLGKESAEQARAAQRAVIEFINLGLPNEGFDAYGRAWATFNTLWREAAEMREQRRQALAKRRIQRAREREQANALTAECSEAWSDPELRKLLKRWSPKEEVESLARTIGDLSNGSPQEVISKSTAWLERFRSTLRAARAEADANAPRVTELLSHVRTSLSTLDQLDLSALDAAERAPAEHEISRLRAQGDAALVDEDIAKLQNLPSAIEALRSELSGKIEVNRINRATEAWKAGLQELGYSVSVRSEGGSGAMVIQASSFPMHSLAATFRTGSDEVSLNVNGEHDTTQCVRDIDSLREVLLKHGIELEMTDWGRVNLGMQWVQEEPLRQAQRKMQL